MKNISSVILFVFLATMTLPPTNSLALEYQGWVKDKSTYRDTLNYIFYRYPSSVIIGEDDYIYLSPSTSESNRIGFGERGDRMLATEENIINREKWLNVNFDELLLLNNRELRSKLIIGEEKVRIEMMSTSVVGGIFGWIAFNSIQNNQDKSISGIIQGILQPLEWFGLGALIGFVGSNYFIDKHNKETEKEFKKVTTK